MSKNTYLNMKKFLSNAIIKILVLIAGTGIILVTGLALLIALPFNLLLKLVAKLED